MALGEILALRRRTIRAPVNPLDKCTIVSIYPRLIDEKKHTIEPGRFIIPPGSVKKPSILVVGPSSWWKEIDFEQPLLEIPNSSIQVAESIVRDYAVGIYGCDMSRSMPGLFWVPGSHNLQSIKENHTVELSNAIVKQERFYNVLVKHADGLWARTNGSPLVISDDMRLAARELNLADSKEWMRDFKITTTMSPCPACGSLRKTEFPICPSCSTIVDRPLYEKLNLSPVPSNKVNEAKVG